MDDIKNNQRTRYPGLYRDTYWGRWTGLEKSTGDTEIIENRNKFATDYHLKSRLPKRTTVKYQKKEEVFKDLNEIKHCPRYDVMKRHIEYYKTTDNKIIVVFSPYDISESMTKLALECGYSLIYPIFSTMATTFVKEITKSTDSNIT